MGDSDATDAYPALEPNAGRTVTPVLRAIAEELGINGSTSPDVSRSRSTDRRRGTLLSRLDDKFSVENACTREYAES